MASSKIDMDPQVDTPSTTRSPKSSGGDFVMDVLNSFAFGDKHKEVDNKTGDSGKNHPASGNHASSKPDHNSSQSSNPKFFGRALSFGQRREAGLHGGGTVRWFHNLFPLRQLFEPRVPYPLWDDNW